MSRFRFAIAAVCVLAAASVAQAHFLWLVTDASGEPSKLQVYFGEVAAPDDPALLGKVAKAEAWALGGREAKALTLKHEGESLFAELSPSEARSTVVLKHSYGVVAKGGAPFLLNYYAKTYPSPLVGNWKEVNDAERLPLELTPRLKDGSVALRVTWKGKPLPGATVTVEGPGIEGKLEGETNDQGDFQAALPKGGLFSIRAKHSEMTAGKLDDKAYDSVRHYSTLSLAYAPVQLTPVAHSFPALPKGTTSFGGAVVGDELFVYGGNYGGAHSYSNEEQSGDLWKLNLKTPGKWEQAAGGPRLQGLAMVAYKGRLYRMGGFTATNKAGEKEDLRSQADFARFDPKTNAWEALPSLPEPRSSHDAAVVGDVLYVVGGWNMQGGGPATKWSETALACDLSAEKLAWKEVAAPAFRRRALALAAFEGKLYCLGGMQENGGPTAEVAIYDPKSNSWSSGPALHGTAMDGFGASAFASADGLYATTISGAIQRLSAGSKGWEYLGQLGDPRFFHRMLPWGETNLVIVGGSNMSTGKTEGLELLTVGGARTARK